METDSTTQNQVASGQENNHGIKVFGATTVAPETKTDVQQPKNEQIPTRTDEPTGTKKETSATTENDRLIENVIEKGDREPSNDSKEKSEPSKGLEIDFGKKDSQKTETSKEQKQETVSLTKESVTSWLKQNGFEGINDISELSKQVTLNDQVEKFKKFNEETGRGIKDFYNLQKDWKSESSENRIKEFIRLKHPNLNEEQVETQFKVINVTPDDEDVMTEREFAKAKAEFDKMDSDAITFLNTKSKEYNVPLDSPKASAPQQTEEDIATQMRPYHDARDKSLKNLNEVKFNIKGLGEINIPIDSDDKKMISDNTYSVDSMVNRWRGKDGNLKMEELLEDNAWGNPVTRIKMISSMADQLNTLIMEKYSKENRNVDLDDLNTRKEQTSRTNGDLTVFKKESETDSQQYGRPVFANR